MTERRHSFPDHHFHRLSKDNSPGRACLRRLRKTAEWRWDRMMIIPVATCLQLILLLVVVLILTGFWAYMFMKLPDQDIFYDTADQAAALAAWSELAQSLLTAIIYKFKGPLDLKEALNLADYSNSKFAVYPTIIDFLPEG
ncbi:hypothetical protein BVRB_031660, partial [Beta vulgaris subsp. vulgaris]